MSDKFDRFKEIFPELLNYLGAFSKLQEKQLSASSYLSVFLSASLSVRSHGTAQFQWKDLMRLDIRVFFETLSRHSCLSITNKMQRYTIFVITINVLHVLGGFSDHHQELKNCTYSIGQMSSLHATTASGSSMQAWHVPDVVWTVFELLMMVGETT